MTEHITDRTKSFALEVVNSYSDLKKTEEGRILGRQLLRSATSIGANVREAQSGQSTRDFVSKLEISS